MSLQTTNRAKKTRTNILLAFFCLITLIPFAVVIFTSFRTTNEIIKEGSIAFPSIWHFENYAKAWEVGRFSQYFLNSIIISIVTVLGVIVFCLSIAYGLVYFDFKGKKIVNTIIVLGLIIPFEIVMIPLFYNIKAMGLMDTYAAIFLPQIALNIPFGTFLLRGFIKDLPKEIVESARTDGASELQVLFKIVLPMLVPAMVALLIFTFMSSWNSYMLPNIMIKSEEYRTLPLGLDFFKGKFTKNVPLTCAASNIIMLPVLMVYFVFQRKMIRGMMIGAVKG